QVFLASDLPRLGARIERLMAARSDSALPADWASRLESLVAPTFALPARLGGVVRDGGQEGDRLTAEQFTVLDQLARNRRVLVTGSAGTGKTMLALEKARRLARFGANTLLTCFNRPLAEHLARAAAGISGLTVLNYHQ